MLGSPRQALATQISAKNSIIDLLTCKTADKNTYLVASEGFKSYLVGGLNPSEKYITSIGMIIPNIWENKTWQPNHQPAYALD